MITTSMVAVWLAYASIALPPAPPAAPAKCCGTCKGTGKVKTGDGLFVVPCPCPATCACKKGVKP